MAKYFIDVVQDFLRTSLDIPIKIKNHNNSFLHWRGSPARPGRASAVEDPNAIFTGPPHCCAPYAHRDSSSSSLM